MAKKITLVVVIALTALAAVLLIMYRSALDEEWQIREAAKRTVVENTYIRTVDRVESFVGEEPYMVVFGRDEEEREAIAWVQGDAVQMEYASEGISEQQVRDAVIAKNPENEILRVLPAVLHDEYLWEVFYKRKDGPTTGYYYDYFRFRDGTLYDTWRLSQRK